MPRQIVHQPLIILIGTVTVLLLLSLPFSKNYLPAFLQKIDVLAVFKEKDTSSLPIHNSTTKIIIPANTKKELQQKLTKAKTMNNAVRIAYLGDSFIEADLITDDLRQQLQQNYGGNGIGFMPIQSISAGMQRSITHTFSNDWTKITTYTKDSKIPLPLSCMAFVSNDNSWVKYSTDKGFTHLTIFIGTITSPCTIVLSIDNRDTTIILAASKKLLNSVHIDINNSKSLKLVCVQKNIVFYGCSFTNDNGVYVDNFSLRGANGTQLAALDSALLQAFNKVNKYDLLILHYGVNVIGNNNKNYDWYTKGIQKTIQTLKQNCTDIPILIISTSDKSCKKDGVYSTDEGVPILVALQQKIAIENKLLFYNLYEAMGGYNSMVQWVNCSPPLAYKDYTHITYKGAKRIADSLYQFITTP